MISDDATRGPGTPEVNGVGSPATPAGDTLIPQLAEHNVTYDDLQTAIKVLTAVASLNPKKKKSKKKRRRNEDGDGSDGGSADGKVGDKEIADKDQSGIEQYQSSNLRPLRKALAQCFELHKLLIYNGKSEDQHYKDRIAERTLKRQKLSESDHQKKYIASTALRRGRVEKLEKLKTDAMDEERAKLEQLKMLVPDGHVDTAALPGTISGASNLLEDEKKSADDDEGDDDDKVVSKPADLTTDGEPVQLPKLRSCYVCKVRFRELHHFYDQLCPKCAALNFAKRHQSADLRGKVAVVTGSRVKIGYQTCLKLLRAGCTVVATTRFPNSAAATYRAEKDFAGWSARLHVYGLDLRDVTGLEAFTRFLKMTYGDNGIDILINNACQTIRRPRGYYTPLVNREQDLWKSSDFTHKALLDGCMSFERIRRQLVLDHAQSGPSVGDKVGQIEGNAATAQDVPLIQMGIDVDQLAAAVEAPLHSAAVAAVDQLAPPTSNTIGSAADKKDVSVPFETTGLSHSAAMSQLVIVPEDVGVSSSVLPPGLEDINGHQLDLRSHNSWLLKMDEISTPEIMECMLINAIAPFVLNSRLQPLMTTPAGADRPDRYIINVSAMEGKFYRYKMPNHPHTNCGKAALNMLTRTSAEDLAISHRIFMNSVDTGWINDENPLEKASKIAETNLFQTPIDEIDAAARILDPIFVGVLMDQEEDANGSAEGVKNVGNKTSRKEKRDKKAYGLFLKDYRETEW
mmetsp:Transcript_23261/g.67144  ORF Transcript_23261/g.67144 Transcript_23261/m.67144 type:complete len:742 (+) Transcript_23261:362-2587(+)|eukprot:CAMPEP_0181041526 /NCGR_PEP_ID=MMETSP1070-20121207/11647_1 /TAXON_ID=265543 /ORGANISM="Minutocellus polymorphus, Strain NH13" /LENGTH=741 /DNA_ID=CAMNT_0023119645 /DNA_START=276 /DNA_END=2501 /DNA_ORIENTATION=+